MSRVNRLLLAILLIGAGAVLTASHPEWGRLRGVAAVMLLLAAVISIGVLSFRPRAENPRTSGRKAGAKLPKSLVGVSSAAVLAVYAAGYHRTSSAEDKFAARTARRRTAAPLAPGSSASAGTAPRPTAARAPSLPAIAPIEPPVRLSGDRPRPSSSGASESAVAVTPPATSSRMPASPKEVAALPATPPLAAPVASPTASSVTAPPGNVAKASPAAPPPPATPPVSPTTTSPPANAAIAQPTPPPAATAQAKYKYKDGTYLGWGSSRHGDIQAEVVIQGGQITAVDIAQCLTRYSCSWIADLPGLVISKQVAGVDYVSGATESSDAFSDAVSDALSKAE